MWRLSMESVKATWQHFIGSSRSMFLCLNLNFLNLTLLWNDISTINKCVGLLYFQHWTSRETMLNFDPTCSWFHHFKLACHWVTSLDTLGVCLSSFRATFPRFISFFQQKTSFQSSFCNLQPSSSKEKTKIKEEAKIVLIMWWWK